MNTHNIYFYEEMAKIIPQLSSNTQFSLLFILLLTEYVFEVIARLFRLLSKTSWHDLGSGIRKKEEPVLDTMEHST